MRMLGLAHLFEPAKQVARIGVQPFQQVAGQRPGHRFMAGLIPQLAKQIDVQPATQKRKSRHVERQRFVGGAPDRKGPVARQAGVQTFVFVKFHQ